MTFTTLNKFDAQGHITKYDSFHTETEAEARIIELHAMGFSDAFYIDDDVAVVNGRHCFQQPRHWVVDKDAKTVKLDQASFDKAIRDGHMKHLRVERDKRLEESDKSVNPDQWHTMDAASRDKWITYRQKLRDLPATTEDPADPTWQEAPE